MMNNLRIRQEHTNARIGNFGTKKLSGEIIDRMIDEEEKRQRRGRVLCGGCYSYKSVSGSCYC